MAGVWRSFVFLTIYLGYTINMCHSLPVATEEITTEAIDDLPENNGTARDLYVIKTIVYEVGILTDASNATDNQTDTQEEVDLTFFGPNSNASVFNLSNIPVPIETNISGISVTGIAPANLGILKLPNGNEDTATLSNFPLKVPLLPNALITVKKNISTSNILKQEELLESFPGILNFKDTTSGSRLEVQTSVIPLANVDDN